MRAYFTDPVSMVRSNFQRIILAGVILEYIAILTVYGNNIGDSGLFINAGKSILKHVNPYLNTEYGNSPVIALLFSLLAGLIPSFLLPVLLQSINIYGLYLFIQEFTPKVSRAKSIALLSLIPFLTSFRGLLADTQVSGIVLGLLVLAFRKSRGPKSIRSSILSAILIWCAFEIKPQFAIVYIVLIIFWTREKLAPLLVGILTISSHLAISLYFGSSLDLLWLQRIQKFSKRSLLPGNESSFWKIAYRFFGGEDILPVVSLLIFGILIVLVAYLAYKRKEIAVTISIFLPLSLAYLHFYDLIGIAIVLTAMSLEYVRVGNLVTIILLCVTYPIDFLEFGVMGILEILAVICLALILQLRIQRRKMTLAVGSFSIVLAALFLISKFDISIQSSLVIVAMLLSACLNIAYPKRKGQLS
ncbi:MAG: hypothetical protein WA090_03450 [Candidatus Nanopelagicaceae bacterium]